MFSRDFPRRFLGLRARAGHRAPGAVAADRQRRLAAERIDQMKKSGERRNVTLKKPMPLYFVYITAWAAEDGIVNFRRDTQKDGVGAVAHVLRRPKPGERHAYRGARRHPRRRGRPRGGRSRYLPRGTFDQVDQPRSDCVSGPLWPQTCRSLMRHNWPTVRGNHEIAGRVRSALRDRASPTPTPTPACSPAERDWLRRSTGPRRDRPRAIACHGRPDDDNRYLLDDIVGGRLVASHPAKVAARLGAAAGAVRLVLCGHQSPARILQLDGSPLVVTPAASVARPTDDASGAAAQRLRGRHAACALRHHRDRSPVADSMSIWSRSATTTWPPHAAPPTTAGPTGRRGWRPAASRAGPERRQARQAAIRSPRRRAAGSPAADRATGPWRYGH